MSSLPVADADREALAVSLARDAAVGAAREELAAIEHILHRKRWFRSPTSWLKERLGESCWSAQRRIFESVRDFRKTAVASCHEIGKSWTASRVAAWWLDIHLLGEAFVVTTAPTGRQVRAILWKEIGRAQTKLGLGRTNKTEWYAHVPGSKEELIAFGFKPADHDPTAFQGIHARHILVIADEGCGIRGTLWDAIESLCANDNARLLVIGNPDDPTAEFADFCKPASGYNALFVSAFDTPVFTGEPVDDSLLPMLIGRTYVEDKRRKWAPHWTWNAEGTCVVPPSDDDSFDTHPFWQSKVLGRFPRAATPGGLIPLDWIRAAQDRFLEIPESDAGGNDLGVDVGAGGDSSTVAHRHGIHVRILHEDHNPDTMRTCGEVVALRRRVLANRVKVDVIGIGKGLTDRGLELGEPFFGINVGQRPTCSCGMAAKKRKKHEDDCNLEVLANFRAQAYWELRERFDPAVGTIALDPTDEDTAAELLTLRYTRLSNGKIQIEKKDLAKRRGIPSPNRAEAVMLACVEPPEPEPPVGGALAGKATW